MGIVISGIQQIGIGIPNVQEAFDWYRKHFGMDIKVFEEYTKSNGGFASEIINILNKCIIQNNERFLSLTHKQLNGRFADAMIFLSES